MEISVSPNGLILDNLNKEGKHTNVDILGGPKLSLDTTSTKL